MMIFSRRKNQSIVINENVTITVIEIRGDKVRLAIANPREVPVHRQEIYEAIHVRRPSPEPPPKPLPPEEVPFVQAVLEDPDDVGIRLIYADWLEERDDPKGEFIRLQCALAQLLPGDPRRKALEERESDLLLQHGAAWRTSLPLVLWHEPRSHPRPRSDR